MVVRAPFIIRSRPRRAAAVTLLGSQRLPFSDITAEHLEHFLYAGSDASPTGMVGVEIYGSVGLLRSLVVADDARTQGLGSALVEEAERYAVARQVSALYLLTTTAEKFFERRGYQRIDRTQAPPAIQATVEFASLCPASSAFMIKQLPNP
jgi:amino-acid N-acetyltransferase